MKRIYMVQPNSIYGESIYFPYAVGSLLAYAFKDSRIKNEYAFQGFVYKKENLDRAVQHFENPDFIGFSCYVWNYEYNKALAKKIKEIYPECLIVFGGHQIHPQGAEVQDENIDILIFGEGEEAFKRVLLSFIEQDTLQEIPNIMYRKNGAQVFTPVQSLTIPERVSPYLEGWFDELMETEKELDFSVVFETNRGCPNRCAFCDWGNIKACVHQYSDELIYKEIDWFSEKKIEYCYCADSNFGLFKRDMQIIEYFIQKNKQTGFPQKFQATYSKNNPETVFEINKKINDAGMSKGATLSFQSMSEDVLQKINRKNMPLRKFKELMELYNSNGIPTYSEIILGLPGETYQSFKEGIEQLLQYGQHMAINFYNCEILLNAEMNQPDYLEKYGIQTAAMEQYQYHTQPYKNAIKEYSRIVVATNTMNREEWIESNILSVFVRTFHNLGLFQCYTIYLHYEKGIDYTDFYEQLIQFSKQNPQTVCGRLYLWLRSKYQSVIDGNGSLTHQEDYFGKLNWPLEEMSFLKVVREIDAFRRETDAFVLSYVEDEAVFQDLKKYQQVVVKTPASKEEILTFENDWYHYFSAVYANHYEPLQKCHIVYRFCPGKIYRDMPNFATYTIFYGRRGGQNIVSDIQKVETDTASQE